MASTPSASALSAVLRCKRPPASAYRLGLTCGAVPSVTRTEQLDEHEKRRFLWGLVLPEARVGFPGVTSVSVQLGSAKLRAQKSRLNVANGPTRNHSGLYTAVSCITSEPGRVMPEEDTGGVGKLSACFRRTDPLPLKFVVLSEPGRVLCEDCGKEHNMSSVISHQLLNFFMLKTTLLQLTAFVLARLGAVWNKISVDDNQLIVCVKCASDHGKKDKTKKGLKPGT